MSIEHEASNLTDILEGPAMDPPPGVIPNFLDPGGSHSLGYGIVILAGALATLSVLVRLTSRYFLRKVGIEDVFLVIALGLFGGLEYIDYSVSISPGVPVHQWNVQFKHLGLFLFRNHLASIFYCLSIMFLKLAILIDWLQVFVPKGQRNAIFWTIHVLIWSNIVFYVSGTLLEIFRCSPRQKIWDPLFEGGTCPVDANTSNFTSGVFNLASDIAILVLPQWVIWNLHMSKAKRVGVSFLFVVGIFATVCGIVRTVYLVKVVNSADLIYNTGIVGLWALGEIAAGFLVIGVPALPKTANSIPITASAISLLRSRARRGTSSGHNEQPSALLWRKLPSRKRRDQWDITELETHNLVTVNNENQKPEPLARYYRIGDTRTPENGRLDGVASDATTVKAVWG
ncbi:uncharacterized protein F4822DRAFT_441946 [Hypoxylon trugodes]|uniref:uncharacterized protein n=1 Tax=Hypoxylon trugodes TaxID=326681 RepID=UPI00219DF214|nr:uncharacterized protein F4822DRAFT_441946 [Hypoxylon trugodes]KAI1390653.1 hypothetical protein F4822DRAFT_441946 [Hypoxylon trugodes]